MGRPDKITAANNFPLSLSLAAALVAGCGGSQPSGAMPQVPAIVLDRTVLHNVASAKSYKVLYAFSGGAQSHPGSGLIDVNGQLYGTTRGTGATHKCGSVYSITTGGIEQLLYSFKRPQRGKCPDASLIDVKGKLYGTTARGGAYGKGTVFSITTAGREHVVHSFGGSDGANPQAGLLDVNGTLYGTTTYGGTENEGTVFRISTTGSERVLHSFFGGTDGEFPVAVLVDVKGTLYGTTHDGGKHQLGTLFSISMSGSEQVLHSFAGGSDGETPLAGLLDVNGILYGTTRNGGRSKSGSQYAGCPASQEGCGTVFSITPSGSEKLLYTFRGNPDGAYPQAALIEAKGKLYGTTRGGGVTSCGRFCGCGTVFSMTLSGSEKVLHRFNCSSDGGDPEASLIDVNGTLYGTTADDGGYRKSGTAFALSP